MGHPRTPGSPPVPNSGFDSRDGAPMPGEITWDEFEKRLIEAGWSPEEAKAEREANEHGWLGDCDGDMDL